MMKKDIWCHFDHITCSDAFCLKMEQMLSAPPVLVTEEESVGGVTQIVQHRYQRLAAVAASLVLLVGMGAGAIYYNRMHHSVVPIPVETTGTQTTTSVTAQTETTTTSQTSESGDVQTETTTTTHKDTTGTRYTGTTTMNETTTTMHHDWAVILDYNRSSMEIGETREIEYYHPSHRGEPIEIRVISCSDNISYEINKANNRIYVTALAAGEASICVRGQGAMFDSYISLHINGDVIEEDYVTALDYDNSPMKIGETRAIRYYHPENPYTLVGCWIVDEASSNISYVLDESSGNVYVTALAAGDASIYIGADGCAFGSYARFTIEPDLAPVLEYDRSPMKVGETRRIRYYHPERADKFEGCYLQGMDYEVFDCMVTDQNGNIPGDGGYIYVTALAAGKVDITVSMDDCTLTSNVRLTIE